MWEVSSETWMSRGDLSGGCLEGGLLFRLKSNPSLRMFLHNTSDVKVFIKFLTKNIILLKLRIGKESDKIHCEIPNF